jgi:glucosamine-6-phosphate deaminase
MEVAGPLQTFCGKNMHIGLYKNYEKMSQNAAVKVLEILAERLKSKSNVVLVPSAGSTPTCLYQILAKEFSTSIDWGRVIVCQMDDYAGLSPNNPLGLAYYLMNHLLQPLNISNYYLLNDKNDRPVYQNKKYDELINTLGGIDLFIHGIGENGHLGFNEPGTSFDSTTRTVKLTESTRLANSRFFGDLQSVPKNGITLGLENIYNANANIILASGTKKRNAVNNMILEEKNTKLPASVLQDHPQTFVYLDKEAAGPFLIANNQQ